MDNIWIYNIWIIYPYAKEYCRIRIKNKHFFIILSSCENWVSRILKILIHVDSSRQYDRVEVLHAYVTIEIKEVYFEVRSSDE